MQTIPVFFEHESSAVQALIPHHFANRRLHVLPRIGETVSLIDKYGKRLYADVIAIKHYMHETQNESDPHEVVIKIS